MPHPDVADPEQGAEPATELFDAAPLVQEPKRGFLRRNRAAHARVPQRSDFTAPPFPERQDDPSESHDDPFADRDPLGQDALGDDNQLPREHASPDHEPAADLEPPAHEEPATHEHEVVPATEASATESEVERHVIFDAPPPRPVFAPVPSSTPESESEPAAADAAGLVPETEEAPAPGSAASERAVDRGARADVTSETVEWGVEEVFAAQDSEPGAPAADPEQDDPLEETPEFLQDTPDHDRLWFEQRPPRDFDFDG